MVRRSAIAEVGGYDESLFFEDFDMWLRLSRRFSFVYLPGRLVRQRMHSHSMSSNPGNAQAMLGSRAVLLSKWLDAGLDVATRNIVLDALAWTAALQLRRAIRKGHARRCGRCMLPKRGRPGGGLTAWQCCRERATLHLLLPLYRLYRNLTGHSAA